jgi:3-hydroxyacyl-CoA dehydrogenase
MKSTTVMKLEMGHPMGPLQLADFIVMYASYFK